MRGRSVDAALIVGLVLVAGAIVWTLFSLGRSPERPPPDAGPSADGPTVPGDAGEDGANGGVVPVSPDGGGPQAVAPDGAAVDGADAAGDDGAGDPVAGDPVAGDPDADDPDADAAGADDAGAGDPSDAAAEQPDADDGPDQGAAGDALGRPDPTVPAEDAPAVPESGSVELGRIGFSFVTGGAGACGIELEAWTHVAVSRELLAAYGCGAEVTLTLDDETDGRTTVQATVADTMNPSFSRTANIYVGEDEPALEFGLTSGTIAPR